MLKCIVARAVLVLALLVMPLMGAARAEDLTFCNQGLKAANAGHFELAINSFTWCLDLGKLSLRTQIMFLYNRGTAYLEKGEYDLAIRDYDQAIQLKPDYAFALNNRGEAYINKGEFDRAIRDFDQAIQFKPDYAFALNNRGGAYLIKGEFDRAIRDFDQAIQFKPDYATAFNNRGLAYINKGEFDRAIRDFDQAIQFKPDYAFALNNRGLAYIDKGEFDRAIRDFDQAIQFKPDGAIAFNNKAWLLTTAQDASVRDGEEAVRLAREAVRLDENEPGFRGTLAAAYAEAGQFDAAAAEQERAIEMLRAQGKGDEVAGLQTRLKLYRSRQPYRE